MRQNKRNETDRETERGCIYIYIIKERKKIRRRVHAYIRGKKVADSNELVIYSAGSDIEHIHTWQLAIWVG